RARFTSTPIAPATRERRRAPELSPFRPLSRRNDEARARKVHEHFADGLIHAADDDFVRRQRGDLTADRNATEIVGRHFYALTGFAVGGIARVDGAGTRWFRHFRDFQRFGGFHRRGLAVADGGDASHPFGDARIFVERRGFFAAVPRNEPDRMIGGEIGEARFWAKQKRL